jgi:hypothetical protein
MIVFLLLFACVSAVSAAEATILDRTHESKVFGETRHYRIFLPSDYESSGKRYPVVYWFHGWSERYNRCVAGRNYDAGSEYGGDTIGAFVAAHDLIVVKWDGYNPRTPGENYLRPYNISPVETDRQFPLYFPELVSYIDANYRTIADREHRATAGLSMGGFMSYWVSGKYPDLVGSASNFMGSSEFNVGPRGMDVEYRHDEMRGNYEGMRTRIVLGAQDFIQFYHRRMNALWNYTRPSHETEEFQFDHGTPGMGKTLAFHLRAFANPLPRPAVWSHNDVYPNFSVWGWEVKSDRRRAGITALENVSAAGFRSSVREWLPGGPVVAGVRVTIVSAPLYPPGKQQGITYVRLRDGEVRRREAVADASGRITFEVDGEPQEVGVSAGPLLALAGFRVEGAAWATAGKPVRLRARFWNKGAAPSPAIPVRWEGFDTNIRFAVARATVPALARGASAEVPLEFTVVDGTREIARIFAVAGKARLPVEVPLFPAAAAERDFRIADGGAATVFRHAVERAQLRLGKGNGDGRVNPGEMFAVLLPDAGASRAAELFTNDACVDNSARVSDAWSGYDHVGATAKYSLPAVRPDCPPGHVIHLLARVQLPDKPNHHVRYAAVEVPVEK